MDDRVKEYEDGTRTESPWDLRRIVSELRTLRSEWRQTTKPDGVTYELPSQEALSDILEGLSAALFPRHFGPPSLTEEGVDYFIGRTLEGALHSLLEQVRREVKLAPGLQHDGRSQREEQALKITRAFAANLPKVRVLLESDIQAAFQGDPAAQSIDEVLFCYPGVVAVAILAWSRSHVIGSRMSFMNCCLPGRAGGSPARFRRTSARPHHCRDCPFRHGDRYSSRRQDRPQLFH